MNLLRQSTIGRCIQLQTCQETNAMQASGATNQTIGFVLGLADHGAGHTHEPSRNARQYAT